MASSSIRRTKEILDLWVSERERWLCVSGGVRYLAGGGGGIFIALGRQPQSKTTA